MHTFTHAYAHMPLLHQCLEVSWEASKLLGPHPFDQILQITGVHLMKSALELLGSRGVDSNDDSEVMTDA